MDTLDLIPGSANPIPSFTRASTYGPTSFIICKIEGVSCRVLLDTGANVCAVSEEWMKTNSPYNKYWGNEDIRVTGVTGVDSALGTANLYFEISDPPAKILSPVIVLKTLANPIIGTNIIIILKAIKDKARMDACSTAKVVVESAPVAAVAVETAPVAATAVDSMVQVAVESAPVAATAVDSTVQVAVETAPVDLTVQVAVETAPVAATAVDSTVQVAVESAPVAATAVDSTVQVAVESALVAATAVDSMVQVAVESALVAATAVDSTVQVAVESTAVSDTPACENKKSVEIFVEGLLSRIVRKAKVDGTVEISEADIKRVFERTWSEVEGVDFAAAEKTFKNLEKTIHRDLCKTWGGAKMVLLHTKLQTPELESVIASSVKQRLAPPPRKLSAVGKFFSAVGNAISRPFRRAR
ncbi:hypothetical protein EYF80_052635 [Liparis tanakae]|uniref:Peptidase A2 domain-containing protein n=1 Tax=Liparis tanakae TaxID=230148 RepID=A0A4Z2F7S4_9TELE|nr:hypothetical protein EYF80_052635 [Liparis tanakae]